MPFDFHHSHNARLSGDERLANLQEPQRIWAVGALYGRYGSLCQLHDVLARRLKPRDRLVYLGNYLGLHALWTGEGPALIDELIAFRNGVIAIPGFFAEDVVFLRGSREDLMLQLLRLPFQKNPVRWLDDAISRGVESYIAAYGNLPELYDQLQGGPIALNRWAHQCGQNIAGHPGHAAFFAKLAPCAATNYGLKPGQIGLVPAGLDPALPLSLQYDELTRPLIDIGALTGWGSYARLVRGEAFGRPFDPHAFVLDLDGGDGLEGKIHAVCLDPQGQLLDVLSF